MEESTGEGGCPFSFQRTRLPSRCRGFPISSRPTLSWGRRGFLPLIEWPILWWGLVPASCAKVLPGTQQYFWLTRLEPALPEGGPLAGAEVPIPLPFDQYSYRGSPRHRLPNRSLVPTNISASNPSRVRSSDMLPPCGAHGPDSGAKLAPKWLKGYRRDRKGWRGSSIVTQIRHLPVSELPRGACSARRSLECVLPSTVVWGALVCITAASALL